MYKEDEYTELKVSLTKEIKKEIVAFANTCGGTIYIGIDDNGNVVGLSNIKQDVEALSNMIKDGIMSDLSLYTNIKQERINDKDIIVLEIKEAPNKPYYLADKGLKSNGVYLRKGNTSLPSSDEVIKKMILDSQNISFEDTISKEQNLHFSYLQEVFNVSNIAINEETFKTLGILTLDGLYTNTGLLLADECPYTTKCAIFEGNNDIKFKDRKEFTGSILKQVANVNEYINVYNKISSDIIGLERIDNRDYPEYSIREAILNAIIHRDYNYTGSILVSLYDNHLEVTSLGGLVKGLKIEDLYYGISQTRNKKVANIFYRLKYIESFGTGIKRIMQSYDKYKIKPVISATDNVFKITLFNTNYIESKDNFENKNVVNMAMSQEDMIIEYLKINKKITRSVVQSLLRISQTSAKNLLNKMIKDNLIILKGVNKGTYYILK